MLLVMAVWAKFPNLPLHMWGHKSLSKIASCFGNPVTTGECT